MTVKIMMINDYNITTTVIITMIIKILMIIMIMIIWVVSWA